MGGLVGTAFDVFKTQIMPWTSISGQGDTVTNLAGNIFAPGVANYFDVQGERTARIEGEEQTKIAVQKAEVAAKQAEADRVAKEAADKIAADKEKADKEAADAAAYLAFRRRAASPFSTSAKGILGKAPTSTKTLLG
jgi:hypothetical protein